MAAADNENAEPPTHDAAVPATKVSPGRAVGGLKNNPSSAIATTAIAVGTRNNRL
jgi:hypothetical protein